MFFCKAEPRECDEVMEVLKTYGKASGQYINFEKSSLLFGKKIYGNVKEAIKISTGKCELIFVSLRDISGSKWKLFARIGCKIG